MNRVVLITGGDLGNRAENCHRAAELIAERVGDVVARSQVRESEAWGFESESRFSNQVLVVQSDLSPQQVLEATQQIEREFGRCRESAKAEHDEAGNRVYRSREMDVDILFYGDICVESETLRVPHPMLHLREFVLEPLREVMAGYVHPSLGVSVEQMLNNLKIK